MVVVVAGVVVVVVGGSVVVVLDATVLTVMRGAGSSPATTNPTSAPTRRTMTPARTSTSVFCRFGGEGCSGVMTCSPAWRNRAI
jgi:hypothetical protein